MTAILEAETVHLPLRLGEITLGTMTLRLSVDKTHFLSDRQPRIPSPSQDDRDGHLI